MLKHRISVLAAIPRFPAVMVGLLVCVALAAGPAAPGTQPVEVTAGAATQPATSAAEIDRLVKQLGSEAFTERDAAQKQLIAVGWAALSALHEARRNKDAEVADRAGRAIEEIEWRLEARISFGGPVKMKEQLPVVAWSQVLEIRELDFILEEGFVRVDVAFQFRDGKLDGATAFKMQLLGKDKRVVAEQTVTEPRIHSLPLERLGHITEKADEPNRSGKTEFRFRSLAPADVAEFYLDVTEVRGQAAQPTATQPASMPARISFGGPVRMEEQLPVVAWSQILEIRELDFILEKGFVRVDVAFQFLDGKLDGAAAFKMQLLGKDKRVVAEQTVTEWRDRNLPVEELGRGVTFGGHDKPNRSGKAEFRFRSVAPADVGEFHLDVTEVP